MDEIIARASKTDVKRISKLLKARKRKLRYEKSLEIVQSWSGHVVIEDQLSKFNDIYEETKPNHKLIEKYVGTIYSCTFDDRKILKSIETLRKTYIRAGNFFYNLNSKTGKLNVIHITDTYVGRKDGIVASGVYIDNYRYPNPKSSEIVHFRKEQIPSQTRRVLDPIIGHATTASDVVYTVATIDPATDKVTNVTFS